MADEADLADLKQQCILDAEIDLHRQAAAKINIEGNGTCVVCGNVVKPRWYNSSMIMPRFCTIECRDQAD